MDPAPQVLNRGTSPLLSQLSLFAFLVVSTLAYGQVALGSSVAEILERGELVVLTHHDTGWIYLEEDGSYRGIDYELMAAFAHSLGVGIRIEGVEGFDALVSALQSGRGDVIASAFSITPEREAVLDFSAHYYPVIVMVVTNEKFRPKTVDELVGKSACVLAGSTHEALLAEFPEGPVVYEPDSKTCLQRVSLGEIDYAFADSPYYFDEKAKFPNLRRAFDLPNPDYYAFAVTTGSDLKRLLDEFLRLGKARGYLYRVIERNQGKEGAELFRLVQERPISPKASGSLPQ